MVVISDSSSIITLNRVGKLDILKNLYGKIIIPKAVEREITSDHKKRINLILNRGIKCDFRISSKLYNDILELAKEK